MHAFIGTAGWTIPRAVATNFPEQGSGLQRYASVFRCAEINSTFYRSHQPRTYERWVRETPPHFRFSAKIPRTITHDARLIDCQARMQSFLDEVRTGLADKLGPLLLQLPPSLMFDPAVVAPFLAMTRTHWSADLVCEPRHPSWFTAEADASLVEHQIARVAADPARAAAGGEPGGWRALAYYRLHGSPRVYFSAYERPALEHLATLIRGENHPWVIFDNTASGAAAANALELGRLSG